MEEDEIHEAQGCQFPRVGDGRHTKGCEQQQQQHPDEELEDVDQQQHMTRTRRGGGGIDGSSSTNNDINNINRFNNWHHHPSRIIRVSRASGGKDRHSKVMTSKGLRDRRVRLSVTTAIQFYDLQDRLGYDQPSKAIEWLIKSAVDAIAELPSLNNTFPEISNQPSDEKLGEKQEFDESTDAAEVDCGETNYNNKSQNLSLSKSSACSSTSETSKGSGLSLSRSNIRVNRNKARERARERAAKEKEKEKEIHHNVNNNNPISQTASFTELLTGGSIHNQNHTTTSPRQQQWCSSSSSRVPMDYFSSGLLLQGPNCSNSSRTLQLGHSSSLTPPPEGMSISLPFSESHSTTEQMQQHLLPFNIPDHLIPAVVTSHHQPSGSDYNLNFTISSSSSSFSLGLTSAAAGYHSNNRGTLQSNSSVSLLPHMQRFSSQSIDGSSSTAMPFFLGGTAAAAPTMENNNHHQIQFPPVFDGRLQLCYGDGTRHSDHKGKAKN